MTAPAFAGVVGLSLRTHPGARRIDTHLATGSHRQLSGDHHALVRGQSAGDYNFIA